MPDSQNQFLFKDENKGIEIWMKREDFLHPSYSGNKFRKLKYNLKEAKQLGYETLLTFGGAYSNHIAATAVAGKENGFQTIGIIRGEELGEHIAQALKGNPTLSLAVQNGMHLHFISRKTYREKNSPAFEKALRAKFGKIYILPEGGTNKLAVKGCEEILTDTENDFDFICCPVGTGGTLAGLINSSSPKQTVMGFSALNADLHDKIDLYTQKQNWQVFPEKYFGGYAKINPALVRFINSFKTHYNILLDPVYTGKMMFALLEKLKDGDLKKNSRILAIHTGGLQGIEGMNHKLRKKGWPTIDF